MKKILAAVFSIVSLCMISNAKVNASEYLGELGNNYSSDAANTMFYYLTEAQDKKVYLEITSDSNTNTVLMEKLPNSDVLAALVEAKQYDEYIYKVCDLTDTNCEYVLDPFSEYLNKDKDRNVLLNTTEVESNWGHLTHPTPSEYERSIYALDVYKFSEDITASPTSEVLATSAFTRMIVPSTRGTINVGIEYLKTLGFPYVELSGLYSNTNYLSINGDLATFTTPLNPLTEYQAMVLKLKGYGMSVIMRTNFTVVSEELENALNSISSTAVVNGKLNYSNTITQRYIKEVYKKWIKEYHVDGFYIEDSQMYGNDFLTSLLTYIQSLNSNMFVYTNSDTSEYKTSDTIQNLLFGSLKELDDKGIVNGKFDAQSLEALYNAMFGEYYQTNNVNKAFNVINNFGSLDDLDIYSKVKATVGVGSNDSTVIYNKIKLALFTIYSSSGTPRVVAGNEFMNTTLIDGTVSDDNKVCIIASICYATGDNKKINWNNLKNNGTVFDISAAYRLGYYYQYPSVYTMKNTKSITLNTDLLDDGVLAITFNYGGKDDGEIERSLFLVNYSNENVTLNKISEKDYTKTKALVGRVSALDDNQTVLYASTFYVFTEVKEVNIPQWIYIVVGIGLLGLVLGFRQLLIHLLKDKKGIEYSSYKVDKGGKNKRNKKEHLLKEESIFATFFTSDPLVKERKEAIKKSMQERKAKKAEEKKKQKEAQNLENNKKENDGK